MVTIREGNSADVARMNSFYESLGRRRSARPDDLLLLAEDHGEVVGVVRLCQEEGYVVLRGMLIAADYRRQGFGTQMLRTLEPHMDGKDCYCLPWAHLVPFYRLVGFDLAEGEVIPGFLAERLRGYLEKSRDPAYQHQMQADLGVSPVGGLRFVCMKRPSG